MTRSTKDALTISENLQDAGANLAFIDMHLDTSSPYGEAFYTIVAAFAQMYRKNISQRTRSAMRRRQANGERMSNRTPYGWQRDPSNPALLAPEPDEQDVIKWIVSEHDMGKGLRTIGRGLWEEGIRCRGGNWHHSTITKILVRAGRL
jgi:DNA invertase Pin-like site-specific DNA recombinase